MGIDDVVGKAKGAMADHADEAKAAIEKAAEFIKEKTDDAGDAKVDSVKEKLEGLFDKE